MREGNRSKALLRIEEWRDAWLHLLGQPDYESTRALGLIDMDRQAERRFGPCLRATRLSGGEKASPGERAGRPAS